MFTNQKDSDNYATDALGWEIIKSYIPRGKRIWAPFYCDGNQKGIFKSMGFDIIHEDKDFFQEYTTQEYDLIIDNPPFSTLKKIATILKELDKPFILIAFSKVMLMKWFQKLFKDDLQAIIPFTRPTFTHLHHPKKGYTPPFGVMYFCYKMKLDKDLIFI